MILPGTPTHQLSKSKEIDGLTFQISMLTPTRSHNLLNRLIRIVGPALAAVIGKQVDNVTPLSETQVDFGKAAQLLFDRMSLTEQAELEQELLSTCTVETPNGWVQLWPVRDTVLLGKPFTLHKLCWFALEVNYASFFDGSAGLLSGALANLRGSAASIHSVGQSGA